MSDYLHIYYSELNDHILASQFLRSEGKIVVAAVINDWPYKIILNLNKSDPDYQYPADIIKFLSSNALPPDITETRSPEKP